MAQDRKITELDVLSSAVDNDVFAIVDSNAAPVPTTKQISAQDLFASPRPIGTISPKTGRFLSLLLSTGSTINEFSTDVTLGGDSDTAVPTEKAVKAYVDAHTSESDRIIADDSYVKVVDDGTAVGYVEVVIEGSQVSVFTDDGLTLISGTTINEFSTDGTLAGNSDNAVPTEKAVKTYVDNSTPVVAHDKIWEDDSYVEVVDDGTATGYVEIVTDGVQVAYFDSSSSTQRFGKASSGSTSNIAVADLSVVVNVQDNSLMDLSKDLQVIGKASSESTSNITIADSSIVANVEDNSVMDLSKDLQVIGLDSSAYIFIDQINETASTFITDATSHVEAFSITEYGVKLEDGARINEFSIDGTLDGNSDLAVPTEKAIRTYVDPWLTIKHDEFDNMFSYNSGVALTSTSPDNIVIGVEAGLYQGQGTEKQNIFIGKYAGRGVDGNPGTNSGNTCIGYYAGNNLRNGLHNVFLGTQSANYLIGSPSNNIGIGRYACAGQNTTDTATPSDNIGLGDSPLLRINSGQHNIAMGDSAMLSLTDGRHNIAMGYRSLYYSLTSEFNIAMGYYSQRRLTAGYYNISIGYFAGYNALTSERCVNIGHQAGINETGNDKLHIANNGTDSLIDGDFAARTLTIHGSLTLDNGTDVNEFSTDGTLADNSDDAVPTEKAVKTYVDNSAGGSLNVVEISSDSTAVNDDAILVDTTGGDVDVEMIPESNSKIIVKKITSDSNVVIISVAGGLIDGVATKTITDIYEAITFIGDGINYYVV